MRVKNAALLLLALTLTLAAVAPMEFLRTLRQKDFAVQPKVVFCTTENDAAHMRAAIDAGADEYVMKPFDRETLHIKLQLVGVA